MADIEGEQELRDSGGEENTGEAAAPQGVPQRAPAQIRSIPGAIDARLVQKLKNELRFLNLQLKTTTARRNEVAALLADMETMSTVVDDAPDDVLADVPPGVVLDDTPAGDSTRGDVHVDFTGTSSSVPAQVALGTSGDDLEDALRAVDEYVADDADAPDRGPKDDLENSAVPPDTTDHDQAADPTSS